MYAIVETGGKQYRVEEGSKFVVEKLPENIGSSVTLDHVLMLGGDALQVGAPYVEGAKVTCEVSDQGRGPRVRVFKRWRRNDSRKLRGHRQYCTTLTVTNISAQ